MLCGRVGTAGYLPGFWALPASFLTGTAAAASVGLINSFGNLGGFVGPYVVGYLKDRTGSYFAGILYLSASALVASMLVLSLRTTRRPRTTGNDVAPGVVNQPLAMESTTARN